MIPKPQTVFLRDGAMAELDVAIELCSMRRILLVVDELAYEACGAKLAMEAALRDYVVTRFSGFEPNPKLLDIERGIAQFRHEAPDGIIAIGGGSAIDMAKLIGFLAVQTDNAREIICGLQTAKCDAVPSIAIPTTAGTGSEATHFAVAYVAGEKYSVAHPSLLPDFAIVDPELTLRLPAAITAATGLDAFCQAVESMWAVGANEESLIFAREAMRLAWEHLAPSVLNPTPASRQGMCRASHLAGQAINISKTTSSHALSYVLTSQYGIPHGVAVAMTLSTMLAFNAGVTAEDCVDPRGAEHVRTRIAEIVEALGARDVDDACRLIDRFIASLNCPHSLAMAGITQERQLREIVESVDAVRMSNNPRATSVESLAQLFVEGEVSVCPETSAATR